MKNTRLTEIIGGIDDDLILSADTKQKTSPKTGILRWASAAVAACLAICAIIAIPKLRPNGEIGNPPADLEDKAGGTDGMINIHAEVIRTGVEYALTNEEAYAFLASVREGIRNELTASGVALGDFKISQTGYSHLRTGDQGNSLAVDWKDFLLYSGDEIKAILTVHKEAGGLYHYVAWGSPGFAAYGEFLAKHRGEELVFLYVGDVDAVITPDNEIFCLSHINASVNRDELASYYRFFKHPENTYIPE